MSIFNTLLIIVLIIIIAWGISTLFFTTNIIYDKMCVAGKLSASDSDTNVITKDVINSNNTANFMLTVWFYIDNWGNSISKEKNILYMATKSNVSTPTELENTLTGISSKTNVDGNLINRYKNLSFGLDKYENNLFIDIETYNDSPDKNSDSSTFTRYIIKNVSVQKWNCLTISVDTKTLDVYLDGKLRNSFILNGLYRNKTTNNSKKNIYLGNMGGQNTGFEGFITRVRYEPNSIDPQKAFSIYQEGINSAVAKSVFDKYGLKVSFMEYDKDIGSFSI
tara:strand:+ start:1927 stop:2763 length:837 start_codon:yes stop_codon:yes gene_type:complete